MGAARRFDIPRRFTMDEIRRLSEDCLGDFSEAAARHGKRALDITCLGDVRELYDILSMRFSERMAFAERLRMRGEIVRFGYVDETRTVPQAAKNPDIISIPSVFVVGLANYYSRLLSRSAETPKVIGDAEQLMWQFYDKSQLAPLPGSYLANSIALWAWRTTAEFVFMHEFAHIWNGHLSLLAARRLAGKPLTELEIATLEMDADCFAFVDLINSIMVDPWIAADRAALLAFFSIPRHLQFDKAVEVFLLWYAVCCFGELTGRDRWSFSSLGQTAYAPLAVRVAYIGSMLLPLAARHRFPADAAFEIAGLARGRAFWDANRVLDNSPPPWETMRPYSNEAHNYIAQLTDTWNYLREELTPLRHGRSELAPRQSSDQWRGLRDLYRAGPLALLRGDIRRPQI